MMMIDCLWLLATAGNRGSLNNKYSVYAAENSQNSCLVFSTDSSFYSTACGQLSDRGFPGANRIPFALKYVIASPHIASLIIHDI